MSILLKTGLYGLFCCLFMVVSVELLLRATDPHGLLIEWDKATLINHALQPDKRGYGYRPGVYHLHNWTMTIDDDGNRITPDSSPDGTYVVFIGDSVTVGFGVNDDETFVNVLTRDMSLNVTNRAVNGYNMPNLLKTVQLETCDCPIVWLMIANDPNEEYQLGTPVAELPSLLLTMYLQPQPRREFTTRNGDLSAFWRDMDTITSDTRVHVVAFEDGLTQRAIERGYEVTVIPRYVGRLSHVDPHPNAAGHGEIAAALMTYVEQWIGKE